MWLILLLDIFKLRVMIKILTNMSAVRDIYLLTFSELYYQWNFYFVIKLPDIVSCQGRLSVTTVNIFSYTYIMPSNNLWMYVGWRVVDWTICHDLDQDPWSRITLITVHQRGQWIHFGQRSNDSLGAPWFCKWPWIIDHDLKYSPQRNAPQLWWC